VRESAIYVAGGTVQAGGGIYLERAADRELLDLCSAGTFAYILTSRQMGKSSVMVQTAEKLNQQNVRTALVDLTALGVTASADQWYKGILLEIQDQLDLITDASSWWKAREDLTIAQRFNLFLKEVVLKEIRGRVVIFVDEIDSTLGLEFTDDFFIAIRYLYNARNIDRDLRRLSFVLSGVATPGDLIKDPERTPFNIGQRVDLTDFTFQESVPLTHGLSIPDERVFGILRQVLGWTSGHPYLTLRVFRSLQESPLDEWTDTELQRRIQDLFLGEKGERDSNLQFVRDMLVRNAHDPDGVLSTYREIRRGKDVADEERSLVKTWLKLSGVVRREQGRLRVRNRIYETVFDLAWERRHRRVNWPRRLARVGAGLLLFLMICAIPVAVWAWKKKRAAESNANLAVARGLAAEANLMRGDPTLLELSTLLAIESIRRIPLFENDQALRECLAQLGSTFSPAPVMRLALKGPVRAVDFSPDGRLLAATSDDGTARVFESASGKELRLLELGRAVKGVAFSPDAARLATANADRVTLWDAATGRQLVEFRSFHLGDANGVAWSPDGRRLAICGSEGNTVIMDTIGRELLSLRGHNDSVNNVKWSPDGRWLATASSDRTTKVWDAASGKELRALHGHAGPVESVAWSPDARFLATASLDGTARLWDTLKGFEIRTIIRDLGPVYAVAISPDERYLATASDDSIVRVFDLPAGKEVAGLRHQSAVHAVAFRPDGWFVATGSGDGAQLFKAVRQKGVSRLAQESTVSLVAFSPDGRSIATVGEDASVRVFEASTGREVRVLGVEPSSSKSSPPAVLALAFSPDGRYLIKGGVDNVARVFEVASGKEVSRLTHNGPVDALAFSRDELSIATGSDDGTVRVWELVTGRPLLSLRHERAVFALAFSPDGHYLVTGSADNTARVFEARSGKEVFRLSQGGPVSVLAFSPDGHYLVTGGADNTARIFDVRRSKEVSRLINRSPISALVFSPNGQYLAAGSGDGTARVFEAASSKEVSRLSYLGAVLAAAFSSDGRKLVVTSRNSEGGISIRTDLLCPDDLIAEACSKLTRNLTGAEWKQYVSEEPYRETCPTLP
jgi:WD40 repeat protein